MPESREDLNLRLEYEQVNENIRMLLDVRFKLLALVPALGGVAVFLLSSMQPVPTGSPVQPATVIPAPQPMMLVLLASILGLMVTLGIVTYDQRNSELYTGLFNRAKYLEERLGFASATGQGAGGQFHERPRTSRRLLGVLLMKHDYGLALAYAPVLGAWLFPIAIALRVLGGVSYANSLEPAAVLAAAGTLVFLEEMLRMDGFWRRMKKSLKKLIVKAARRYQRLRLRMERRHG